MTDHPLTPPEDLLQQMTNPYRAMCAELVDALHEHICEYEGQGFGRELLTRARALLAQPVAEGAKPVAVSERLPGPEDCDEKGRCWWHRYTPTKEWHLQRVYIGRYNYWLPANALPIPELAQDPTKTPVDAL
jgi:hypothetical protein